MEAHSCGDPVAEFCAGLRRLQQQARLDRTRLARRLGYSRSQLYKILDGRITRPPDWDRLVASLVRVCTGNDEHALKAWRQRHDVLVEVHHALQHRERHDHRLPSPTQRVPLGPDRGLPVFAEQNATTDSVRSATPTPDESPPVSAPHQMPSLTGLGDAGDECERGREAYRQRRWLDAYRVLCRVDETVGLDVADLELLATSAYLVCRDDDAWGALERAHRTYLTLRSAIHSYNPRSFTGQSSVYAHAPCSTARRRAWYASFSRLQSVDEAMFLRGAPHTPRNAPGITPAPLPPQSGTLPPNIAHRSSTTIPCPLQPHVGR